MQRKLGIGRALTALCAACLLGLPMTALWAQGPGGGGGQMPPEMQAKMKAWQKWRESHKNISSLQTMLFQIRQIDKDPTTQITKPQAAKILPVLKSWRHKPAMSDDQAKQVSKKIGAVLNEKQLKKMSTFQPRGRGGMGGPGGGGRMGGGPGGPGGGPGGGGGGRFGGGPGGGGRRGGFPDPPTGDFNPLNPESRPGGQGGGRFGRSVDELITTLEQRAK
jgi:hypothetical protein